MTATAESAGSIEAVEAVDPAGSEVPAPPSSRDAAPSGNPRRRRFAGVVARTRPALHRVRGLSGRILSPVTAAGWTVAAIGLVGWLIGWRLGWIEWTTIAAACLVVLLIAYAFTLGQARLQVTLSLAPARVVVGERAGGSLAVANPANRRAFPVRMELPVGGGVAGFQVPSLAAGAEHEELFVVPTSRRAVIPVGPASSVRGDPLGLVRRAVSWTDVHLLYVHPRTVSLEQFGAGFLRDLEGQTTRDLSTNDVAFHTLRDYVPGDDRRFVHWRTTARTGQLMVRQFVDTRRSHLSVIVSAAAADYADDDEFETAVSIGGSVALRAIRDEQDLTVLVGDVALPTPSGQRLLDGLAGVELATTATGLAAATRTVVRLAPDTSVAILVVGSRTDLAAVTAAQSSLSPDVRVIVLRVDPAGSGGLAMVGNTAVLTLSDLQGLPMAMRAVMQR